MSAGPAGGGHVLRRARRFAPVVAVLTFLSTCAPPPAGSTAATTSIRAAIRVDQVGYALTAPKRAYLMTPGLATRAAFRVIDEHGRVVHTAPLRADSGAWSTFYPFVYALDFDSVDRAGGYHIEVTGPFPAASPDFRIGAAAELYAAPLTNALSYFRNERDGADFIRSALRTAPAHLNDGTAMTYLTPTVDGNGTFAGDLTALGKTIDASGGWWDAGDYLKFVQTTSYVVALLGIGVRDFPGKMGVEARLSDFTAEVKFGTDFL